MGETISVQVNGVEIQAFTDTLNDSPVPAMTPGKTYDFRNLNAKAPSKAIAIQPKPTPTVLGSATNTVSLVLPPEGSALPTTLPLIQGTGVPGKTISLIIGMTNPYGDSTLVGPDGMWNYTPKQSLAPGKQSVTMTTTTIQNKLVALTHTFTILKSGSQVLGDATPSGTPTTTLTPTPTPTPDLSASISATPIASLAAQPVPTSGYDLPTILLSIMSIGLMIGGGIIFIK